MPGTAGQSRLAAGVQDGVDVVVVMLRGDVAHFQFSWHARKNTIVLQYMGG
jgi:hypothetical protein